MNRKTWKIGRNSALLASAGFVIVFCLIFFFESLWVVMAKQEPSLEPEEMLGLPSLAFFLILSLSLYLQVYAKTLYANALGSLVIASLISMTKVVSELMPDE